MLVEILDPVRRARLHPRRLRLRPALGPALRIDHASAGKAGDAADDGRRIGHQPGVGIVGGFGIKAHRRYTPA